MRSGDPRTPLFVACACAALTYLVVGKLTPFDALRQLPIPHPDLHRTITTTTALAESLGDQLQSDQRIARLEEHFVRREARAAPRASGRTVVEQRTLPPFDSILLHDGANVTVTIDDQTTVSVEGDETQAQAVSTTVEHGMLVVGQTGASHLNVRLPHLRSLHVDGASRLNLSGLRDPISIVASGAGTVKASGNVDSVDLVLNGGGDFELSQLRTKDAKVVLTGSGKAALYATRKLSATVLGPGSVRYLGDPRVVQNVLGPGSVAPICTS